MNLTFLFVCLYVCIDGVAKESYNLVFYLYIYMYTSKECGRVATVEIQCHAK